MDQLQASNKSPTAKHAQHSGAICYKLGKTKCGCLGILAQTDRKSKQSRNKVTDIFFFFGRNVTSLRAPPPSMLQRCGRVVVGSLKLLEHCAGT